MTKWWSDVKGRELLLCVSGIGFKMMAGPYSLRESVLDVLEGVVFPQDFHFDMSYEEDYHQASTRFNREWSIITLLRGLISTWLEHSKAISSFAWYWQTIWRGVFSVLISFWFLLWYFVVNKYWMISLGDWLSLGWRPLRAWEKDVRHYLSRSEQIDEEDLEQDSQPPWNETHLLFDTYTRTGRIGESWVAVGWRQVY